MKYQNNVTWNDKWIVEEVFKGKKGGYFVEAGAVTGIGGSSCYVLEKELEWTGIAIEARESIIPGLRHNRPNSIAVNACLWYKEGDEVDFVEYEHGEGACGLSGIINQDCSMTRPDKISHHSRPPAMKSSKQIIKKKTTTLDRILSDNNAPNIIDYLSLDIERSELAVLSTFPFDKYKFKAISTEDQSNGPLLKNNGYVQVINPFCEHIFESYFIHEEFIQIKYMMV